MTSNNKNSHLFLFLFQYMYEFLDALLTCQTAPEEVRYKTPDTLLTIGSYF